MTVLQLTAQVEKWIGSRPLINWQIQNFKAPNILFLFQNNKGTEESASTLSDLGMVLTFCIVTIYLCA